MDEILRSLWSLHRSLSLITASFWAPHCETTHYHNSFKNTIDIKKLPTWVWEWPPRLLTPISEVESQNLPTTKFLQFMQNWKLFFKCNPHLQLFRSCFIVCVYVDMKYTSVKHLLLSLPALDMWSILWWDNVVWFWRRVWLTGPTEGS